MTYKMYITRLLILLLVFTVFAFFESNYLRSLNVPYTTSDLLIDYQVSKLYSANNFELVVVGDSSAGNAINATYMSKLTEMETVNVSLTGGAGFVGTYNMIRHAINTQPNLKGVVIVQTLDIWRRGFAEKSYLSTLYDLPPLKFEGILSEKGELAQFNPSEIYWFLRYKLRGVNQGVGIENDYIAQRDARYSNEGISLDNDEGLSSFISDEKIQMLKLIGSLCEKNSLTCLYLHGPIHDGFYQNSKEVVVDINKKLEKSMSVKVYKDLFIYPGNKMGDSTDHIDPQYKDAVTEDYFRVIKKYIQGAV